MALLLTSRIVSGVVIVHASGRLCFLEVALRDHVRERLAEGYLEFVLNLADVPYIDSFGLGELITVWTSVRDKGGQVVFLRPTDHVLQLFELTKLNGIFKVARDEAQAITSAQMDLTARTHG